MPLPAIAAAVGRGAMVVGRGAVSVGKGATKLAQKGGQVAAKGAKAGARAAKKGGQAVQKGARKASDIKSQIQKGRRQMRQMQDVQNMMKENEDEDENENESVSGLNSSKKGLVTFPGAKLGKIGRMSQTKKGGLNTKSQTSSKLNGVSGGMQSKIKSNALSKTAALKSAAKISSITKGKYAQRDMIAKTIDSEIKAFNTTLSSLDCATAGGSLMVTIIPYTLTYGWMTIQFFYGDIIAKGKHKYVAPLKWRVPPVPVDPNAYGRKLQVILFWLFLAFVGTVIMINFLLLLLIMIAPFIFIGILAQEILNMF